MAKLDTRLSPSRGLGFIRAGLAMAEAQRKFGNPDAAPALAAERWGIPQLALVVRQAVSAGSTSSLAELAEFRTEIDEFFGLVVERSLLGRLAGARRVPLRTQIVPAVGTGTTAHWVKEGDSSPLSGISLDTLALEPHKVVAIAVVTDEAMKASAVTELALRADLTRACVAAIDGALLDPANAGASGEKPASILDGIPETATTTDPLLALIEDFGGDLSSAFFVMGPKTAAGLAGLDYPNLGARGGDALGVPVLTSTAAPAGIIALVDAAGLAYGDDGGSLEISTEAALEMMDNPTGHSITPTATTLVSLWQTNSVALKASRSVSWWARPGSVVWTSTAAS